MKILPFWTQRFHLKISSCILKNKTSKDINWFFDTVVDSRDLIDFKIAKITKTANEVTVKIKNKTNINVPISIYQLKQDSVITKKWIENIKTDTTLVFQKN